LNATHSDALPSVGTWQALVQTPSPRETARLRSGYWQRSDQRDLGPHDITVNIVQSNVMATDMAAGSADSLPPADGGACKFREARVGRHRAMMNVLEKLLIASQSRWSPSDGLLISPPTVNALLICWRDFRALQADLPQGFAFCALSAIGQ
jgi:hypothetical protein